MTDRTNEQWLADLRADGEQQQLALEDLRKRLHRSIYYYLSQERSDLRDLAAKELQAMAGDMAQDCLPPEKHSTSTEDVSVLRRISLTFIVSAGLASRMPPDRPRIVSI